MEGYGGTSCQVVFSTTVSCLSNTYLITLEDTRRPTKTKLSEVEVYRSIYTEESLFNPIGPEGCIAIDIALAKGGTEAVVESYYSVMKSQKKFGGQSNTNLALRLYGSFVLLTFSMQLIGIWKATPFRKLQQ